MDWVNRMNRVIDYVENHLSNEINEKEISKITACSFSLFQGSFAQITGISLSEYVRRRKLTCAAYDLQNTNEKVIDIALKYGYQSSDAFCVAFKRLHGVTPTSAKKDSVKLTFYCRLSFTLTIKGVDKMDYTIIEKAPFNVIGVRRTTPYGGGTWAVVKSDGSSESIKKMTGRIYDLGLCFGFSEDGSNDYMCGIEWEDKPIDGLDIFNYPAATWLRFEAKGNISCQILGSVWQRINHEFLPQSKYKKSGLPTIEKFILWDEAANICNVEIWIPVALK
ncbi:helix-turn-helix domain-containing protein [Clostridium sp. BNL1100]|uniref:AraC family transcriptional regulator n=1 Tax=Clostridium sp. BNL1100 TaxID=755731 RepID=UPI00024A75BF|nr:helix-turn-helix domain-containing protein [Clostridium sp. BNL1100]AEY65575.1 DNA-binding domain-containing protein, AraC-type [Clostridium sp. BNL1100]